MANTINIAADLGAMGAALQLLIGGPGLIYTAFFSALSALLQVFVPYSRYVRMLKWLSLVLLAYVATVFFTEHSLARRGLAYAASDAVVQV